MSAAQPQGVLPIGVVVERRPASSPWLDAIWRSVALLTGQPKAAPWTRLPATSHAATFYAGAAQLELYRTETAHYRDNLAAVTPAIWVALRPTGADPPYRLLAVTADPAEGESFTQAGDDVVDALPMPAAVRRFIEAFVAQHHVEAQPAYKRRRTPPDPEGLARKGPRRAGRYT